MSDVIKNISSQYKDRIIFLKNIILMVIPLMWCILSYDKSANLVPELYFQMQIVCCCISLFALISIFHPRKIIRIIWLLLLIIVSYETVIGFLQILSGLRNFTFVLPKGTFVNSSLFGGVMAVALIVFVESLKENNKNLFFAIFIRLQYSFACFCLLHH